MKKIILLLFSFLMTAKLIAQQSLTTKQQAVQQTVIKMFEALSNRDSVNLKAHCTADITLYEYGQIWNIDTLIMKAITQNKTSDFKRTNTFDFINTKADKTTALVTYHLQSTLTPDGKQGSVQWLETVVLAKAKNSGR